MQWAKQKQAGFTIVELLIVVVVIAILAAITIVAFTGIQSRTRDSERAAETKSVQKAIEMYKADKGEYPLHSTGSENNGYNLTVLRPLLVPEYINDLPSDPNAARYYQYVRDASVNAYGIRVQYETQPQCHLGTNNQSKSWWSVPAC